MCWEPDPWQRSPVFNFIQGADINALIESQKVNSLYTAVARVNDKNLLISDDQYKTQLMFSLVQQVFH